MSAKKSNLLYSCQRRLAEFDRNGYNVLLSWGQEYRVTADTSAKLSNQQPLSSGTLRRVIATIIGLPLKLDRESRGLYVLIYQTHEGSTAPGDFLF